MVHATGDTFQRVKAHARKAGPGSGGSGQVDRSDSRRTRTTAKRELSDVVAEPPLSTIQNYIWTQERVWAGKISPFLFGKVLKVGNGLGYLTQFFQQSGINVVTLDISESSAAMNKGAAVLYDGILFPFKDAAFDCVVFAFVLHHTPNPFSLLQEAYRVGSRIVVLEETYDSIFSKVDLVTRDIYVNLRARQDAPIFWKSYFRSGVLERYFLKTGLYIVYHCSQPKRTTVKNCT
jgi:SAM-dependent methyltransferase